MTGRLPRKTQKEVDALLATKAMIARVAEAEHQARLAAAEKRKLNKAENGSTIDLVEDEEALSTPKKKATPKPKKPSKG